MGEPLQRGLLGWPPEGNVAEPAARSWGQQPWCLGTVVTKLEPALLCEDGNMQESLEGGRLVARGLAGQQLGREAEWGVWAVPPLPSGKFVQRTGTAPHGPCEGVARELRSGHRPHASACPCPAGAMTPSVPTQHPREMAVGEPWEASPQGTLGPTVGHPWVPFLSSRGL